MMMNVNEADRLRTISAEIIVDYLFSNDSVDIIDPVRRSTSCNIATGYSSQRSAAASLDAWSAVNMMSHVL
jgi:hypothetical protein